MKKQSYLVASLLLIGTMPTLTSCFVGSFGCMNKMFEWNYEVSDNRYIAALIGIILGPIEFAVGGFLDTVIFNSMEFWTGSNPMASTQVVQGSDGQFYAVASNGQGGYTVTCQQTGERVEYLFDAQTHTWSLDLDGQCIKLFTLTAPNEAQVYVTGMGQTMSINLDQEGIMAYEAMVEDSNLLALD